MFGGGKTSFGRFIQPLLRELGELPKDRQTHSMETMGLIYKFIKDKDIKGMNFTRDDLMFMMADRVGNLIRRPVINTYFYQVLNREIQAENSDEERAREVFLRTFNRRLIEIYGKTRTETRDYAQLSQG